MSKVVLGKGLGALIPSEDSGGSSERKFKTVALDKIGPNPMQPRRSFDEQGLQQLAQSFRENGIIQPLLVRQDGSNYTIIAGERRYRAAALAGLTEVPVVVRSDASDTEMLEVALVENIQREDLNPMELADAYRRLVNDCGLTQNELALKVGKSRASVANVLRLHSLPDEIKQMLRESKLTEGHARAILAVDSEEGMLKLARKIISDNLTVRDAEHHATASKPRKLVPRKKTPELTEIENYMKRLLATSVKINPGVRKGKIEIEYYGDEDLERLLELMRKIETH